MLANTDTCEPFAIKPRHLLSISTTDLYPDRNNNNKHTSNDNNDDDSTSAGKTESGKNTGNIERNEMSY